MWFKFDVRIINFRRMDPGMACKTHRNDMSHEEREMDAQGQSFLREMYFIVHGNTLKWHTILDTTLLRPLARFTIGGLALLSSRSLPDSPGNATFSFTRGSRMCLFNTGIRLLGELDVDPPMYTILSHHIPGYAMTARCQGLCKNFLCLW